MAVKAFSPKEAFTHIGLKALVYGPPGSGKTTLAKTMPKPVLVIDFEGGIITLLNEPDILVCPVSDTTELRTVVEELLHDTQFRSVVFDGLSIFLRRRMQQIRGDKERATWDDWQKLTNEVRAAVFPLLQLRKHLLLTSLPKYLRNRDEKGREFGPIIGAMPNLTPAVMQELIAACDLVGYLVAPNDPLFPDVTDRIVLFSPVDGLRITTKSRIPQLTRVQPNFSEWLQLAGAPDLIPQPTPIPTMQLPSQPREQPEPPEQPSQVQPTQQEPQEITASDELTREIFRTARELKMDNKALGRLARQYFGEGYVRNLSDEQKRKLLDIMRSQLQQRTAATQPDAGTPANEPQPLEPNGAVEQFLQAWREFRGSAEPFPFERELAEIAVKRDWQPDELEAAITIKVLETGFDINQIQVPDNGYWVSGVPEEILQQVVHSLAEGGEI